MGKVNNLQTILKSTVSNFPKQKIGSQLLQHTQLMAPQVCIFEICPYYVYISQRNVPLQFEDWDQLIKLAL